MTNKELDKQVNQIIDTAFAAIDEANIDGDCDRHIKEVLINHFKSIIIKSILFEKDFYDLTLSLNGETRENLSDGVKLFLAAIRPKLIMGVENKIKENNLSIYAMNDFELYFRNSINELSVNKNAE